MQSCSIHHCVLFFLTFTFTTDLVSAAVFTVLGKFHQPVTLPCEKECPDPARWALTENREVVAECDQTSCRSLQAGYEMSHNKYQRGDLSLTITSADYSMRNTYTCECDIVDVLTLRLRIDTVFSAVKVTLGRDLILDLSVPEPVEVIYKGEDSAADEQICTVTQTSLQSKDKYTPRTSLHYPELTLRDVSRSDAGRYIIRDRENKEDIRVYSVSVTGLTNGETAGIVFGVLLAVMVLVGLMMYLGKSYKERRQVNNQMKAVTKLIKKVKDEKLGPDSEEQIEQNMEAVEAVEKEIDDLEQKYRQNRNYSRYIRLFCDQKRRELQLWKIFLYSLEKESLQPKTEEVMQMFVDAVMIIEIFKLNATKEDQQTHLHKRSEVELYLKYFEIWCREKRNELDTFKQQHSDIARDIVLMKDMETLLNALEKWCTNRRAELDDPKDETEVTEGTPLKERV